MRAEASFQISDVFSADDPVARFVTVLAMVNNEWHRSMHLMGLIADDPDDRGIRLLLFRQQAASYLEAVEWITDSRRRFVAISDYIDKINRVESVHEHYTRLLAGLDPESPHYMDWLTGHRNVTAHFPKLHPDAFEHDDEEIANALRAAAENPGTVSVATPTEGAVRFDFADEVAIQLLPNLVENPGEAEKLADARLALMRFAVYAIGTYLIRSEAPGR